MFTFTKSFVLACSAACLLVGCESVKSRAARAQRHVSAFTNDYAVAVSAQSVPVVDLSSDSLHASVDFAWLHRPNLESAYLSVSNAVLALRTVSCDRELQASLSGGYSQSSLNTGSHFSWRQTRGRATTDITFDLLIYDWGRLDAREKQARANLMAAKRTFADEQLAIFNEVAQARFTLLRNNALLDVARTNELMHAEHLKQSESLFSAGEAKKLDVLKARVDLSDARLETINASNDVVTAKAELLRALGYESIDAARAIVVLPTRGTLETSSNQLSRTTFDATAALALARTNAPSLMMLRAKLRAASAQVDYAISELLPEISASAAFNYMDPTWNWTWGVKAAQYLLDGKRREIAVDTAIVEMEQARAAVEEAEQKLSYNLAVAAATRDKARQSLATATVEVAQAKENYETVKAQYRVGDASRLDFTDAVSTLVSALGTRVKAFYAAEIAEAEIIRLIGLPPQIDRTPNSKKAK